MTDYEEGDRGGDPLTYTEGVDLNPLLADTDGDGFDDGMEIAADHDPLVDNDTPVWGDINDDGAVNAADVLLVTRDVLGLITLSDAETVRGNLAPLANGVPPYNETLKMICAHAPSCRCDEVLMVDHRRPSLRYRRL